MGFACPVCSAPQADGEHLADHLAFVALIHGDEHETWLAEHVPDWAERDPEGLASVVTELADETDHEVVDGSGAHDDRGPDRQFRATREGDVGVERAHSDPEVRRIVERAREMTRRMQGADDAEEE